MHHLRRVFELVRPDDASPASSPAVRYIRTDASGLTYPRPNLCQFASTRTRIDDTRVLRLTLWARMAAS
jgi:hypothetical protein